jgi:hypothetical protein
MIDVSRALIAGVAVIGLFGVPDAQVLMVSKGRERSARA